MVEPGWACSGGTDINSDLCRPILMPAIEKVIMAGEIVRIYFKTTVMVKNEFEY
jgi:hypothetical protein